MKHTYEKPVITVDAGMAEGVYAASGATDTSISYSEATVTANWGDSGQANFTLNLSKANRSQLTVILTFNLTPTSVWGGGASVTRTGNTATLYWYSAPESADLTVQAYGNITTLAITDATASNN